MTDSQTKEEVLNKWHARYDPVDQGFYTPPPDTTANPRHAVVRQMVVDMQEVYTRLREEMPDWETLTVYADVIVFPSPTEENSEFAVAFMDNNAAITLFARLIQVAGPQGIIASYSDQATLTVYAAAMEGELQFYYTSLSNKGDLPQVQVCVPAGSVGTQIQAGREMAAKPLANIQALDLSEEGDVYWLMESSYNVAATLAHSEPELAESLARWINTISRQSPALGFLAAQSARLAIQAQQAQSAVNFVPILMADAYKELDTSYLAGVAAYETAFNNLTAALDAKKDASGYATAMLSYFSDKASASNTLTSQAKQNLAAAKSALDNDEAQLQDHLLNVVLPARHRFQSGVETFKEQKKAEAIRNAVFAAVQVTASVAEMAAGDGAGAAGVAEGVAQGAEAASKLAEVMEKLAKVIKALATIVEGLEKLEETIAKFDDAGDSTPDDLKTSLTIPTDDSVFSDTSWTLFVNSAQHALRPYTPAYTTDNVIDGTDEYLQSLEDLGTYGQAVYNDRVAVVRNQQQLLQMKLDEMANKRMAGRLRDLLGQQGQDQAALEKAKLLFYRKLLALKGRLLLALNDRFASWKYWALSSDPLPANFSLADTAGDLQAKLTSMEEKRLAAIQAFFPGPKKLDVPIRITKAAYPRQFSDFQQHGHFTLSLALDQAEFAGFARVRLSDLDVYLNDEAVVDPKATVKLTVSTLSAYDDRNQAGEVFHFVAAPFSGRFQYQRAQHSPVADLKADDVFAADYFRPTPFTTWRIALDSDNRAEINYDALTEVRLQFIGTRIDMK